ncbi:MAG: hypothetical protein GY910_25250 [bacterium]|nr:hypothetical protein [Deltaproteobacteria bacterium]MCP4908294.1 hypothetical protein [bacterium]
MGVHRLIVFTEPKPDQDAEYNKWYDEVHLREVLETDGFVAAQRFAVAPSQLGEVGKSVPSRYLAIYEIEAESLDSALEKLFSRTGEMNMTDAMDLASATAIGYSAIGERQRSA